ncbi:MAG: DUF512 domain-containing protein, partial [Lachnospiraceae bacterium]|nr:DUF512 domain-containing protein [Lachnospiraceae bacterium]
MKKNRHIIKKVEEESIAAQMDIEPGDELLAINDQSIEDIFDYRFLIRDEYIEVLIKKPDGEEWLLEIDKDEDEDLGLEFENSMMDNYRSCHNKCIFCFIDQMPKGMRETLYFKDDDSRLSFLQGNYVTLTNMSDDDVDRICRYRLEPINISFQTTNPELRCRMLGNRFAGEALKKVDRLYEAGIEMNGQIVLCKGINDGDELRRSIRDMSAYFPYLRSVSVVPVGLTRFREGLYPLEPFEKEDACEVIDIIEGFQETFFKENGAHFVHASDEWYLLAGRELPEAERYDGYLQYENGVGMLRLLTDEFEIALSAAKRDDHIDKSKTRTVSVATGALAYRTIASMAERIGEVFPNIKVHVYCIENKFFGPRITVSGLLTGQDMIDGLKDKELGEVVFLPENVLRCGEEVFLDDVTMTEFSQTLQVEADIV